MARHLVAGGPVTDLAGHVPMQTSAPDPAVSPFWVDTSTSPPTTPGVWELVAG